MIKPGNIKLVLLLAFIGIVLIALVEPIAANNMGQGNTGEHSENETAAHLNNETDMMHSMMQHMMQHMGEHSANETMMCCIMENRSANETMMCCIMGDHLASKTMSQSIMGNYSANETMMQPMMGNYSASGSCFIVAIDQNISSAQARLDCARFWLETAIKLHEVHLKDPSTATNESQMEMMDQMMRAYECVTGKNVTSEINNTTAGQAPTGDEHGHQA